MHHTETSALDLECALVQLLRHIPTGIFKWRQLSPAWCQCLQSQEALQAAYTNPFRICFSQDWNLANGSLEQKWSAVFQGLSLQACSGNLRCLNLQLPVESGDFFIGEVGKLLPEGLLVLELDLSYKYCDNDMNEFVSDAGLCRFAESLPHSLLELRLKVSNGSRPHLHENKPVSDTEKSRLSITDVGIEVLSKHLPSQLLCFELQLFSCNITQAGAAHISRGIPQGLQELSLCFDDQGLPGRADSDSHLNWDRIGAAGMREISRCLPTSLQSLKLFLFGCEIKDEGLLEVSAQLKQLPCLNSLDIDLGCNHDLGTGALCNLFRSLPSGLMNLSLAFQEIDEHSLAELMNRLSLLPFLDSLNLTFSGDYMQGTKACGVGLTDCQHLNRSFGVAGLMSKSGGVVKALLQGVPHRFQEHIWVECSRDSVRSTDESDFDEMLSDEGGGSAESEIDRHLYQ